MVLRARPELLQEMEGLSLEEKEVGSFAGSTEVELIAVAVNQSVESKFAVGVAWPSFTLPGTGECPT